MFPKKYNKEQYSGLSFSKAGVQEKWVAVVTCSADFSATVQLFAADILYVLTRLIT